MEKLLTIEQASETLNLNPFTLRRWDNEGKIRCLRLQNKYRRIPESEINRILGIQNTKTSYIYIYARVSSVGQKEDLVRQINKQAEICFSGVRSVFRYT